MQHLQKIEHIGIAVKDLDSAIRTYTMLMGAEPYKAEEVVSEGVMTVFFYIGQSKIELLHATKEDSPIAKFIEKRGEGIHHIAFAVEDIYLAMADMQAGGFKLINEVPKRGADNKLICFIHPKETNGTLIELCQEIKD